MDAPDPAAPARQALDDPRRARDGPRRARVEIHWTWVATVVLLAVAFGTRRIPGARPDWPELATWSTAIGTSVLVGASLVFHEAAHAVVARAFGARAVVLRFALAGGAVTTDARQIGPRGVAATAVAGPLGNFLFTLVAGAAALALDPAAPTGGLLWGTPVVDGTGGASLVVQGLSLALADAATLNALACALNLLPIPPLDGGIAVEAVVWHLFGWTGAARLVARVAASGLFGFAIWQFATGDVLHGALAAVIALLVDRLGADRR